MEQQLKNIPKTAGKDWLKTNRAMARNMLEFVAELTQKFGDTFLIDMGFMQVYSSSDPDFIKYVLQTNHKNYYKSRAYEVLKMGLGEGLISSEGDFWRKQRRLSQPVFYKNNLENLFADMGRSTVEFLDFLKKNRGKKIDISAAMTKITATIVLRALFNVEGTERLDKIYYAMDEMQTYIMKHVQSPVVSKLLYINGGHQRFKREMKVMDDLVYEIMSDRRKSGAPKDDLLQMLMDVKDADTGETMSDKQLRDELLTLFSAGHETSANALSWTLYLLAQNPEIIKKLRAEADSVMPNQEMPTFEQLRALKYTEQVINEGMRLFPPAWVVGRRPYEEDNVNGYRIGKDKNVLLQIYEMHRAPALWENPLKFDPDRFTPEKMKTYHKNQFLPFGAGPRMCIGNHFAMMEMQLLLSTIVQRFDFEPDETQKVVEAEPLITLRPKTGIRLTVR